MPLPSPEPSLDVATAPPAEVLPVEAPPRFWLLRWVTAPQLRWILLAMLYVIVQPPEKGLGVDLCTLHRYTGAPCPGCGMTRSGANLVRGDFRRAFQFHPFGYIFMPVLFGLAGLSLLPSAWRGVVAARLSRYDRGFRIAYLTVIVTFLIFGLIRFFLVLAGVLTFPLNWP